jgi:hypothetical protein
MKGILKVKHIAGVHYRGNEFWYIGKCKIDGFPMYSFYLDENLKNLKYYYPNFIFNTRPGYTPTESDFELFPSIEENWDPRKSMTERYSGKNILGTDDLIFRLLSAPTEKLYYFDYVYESEFDNRLLLML